jgi:ABC-type phosphate/phosphonate transport system substrate-binding protein
LLGALWLIGADASAQPKTIRLAMARTFIEDKPKSYIEIATNDFKEVLKKTSGLDGSFHIKDAAFEIANKLDKKELDIGILHAHEYAWVQPKHPELQPLLIAGNKRLAERAHIVIHQKSAAKSFADLAGKKLDLPKGAGEPSRLYVAKLCAEHAKKKPGEFFESIMKSQTQGDALDELARGKSDVAVVDSFALEFYKDVKGPVFEKHLRVMQESEAFPPAVLVSRKGGLDEATLKQFRDGLLKAHTDSLGRDMMKAWNMDAFEPIPADYDKKLAEISKAYPAP